jgi:hypothetical protein
VGKSAGLSVYKKKKKKKKKTVGKVDAFAYVARSLSFR